MTTTTRGVPYPEPADPNDVPSDIEALAEWMDSNPGVLVVTTAQRNALLGADRWVGRVVYNTDFHTLDCWNGVVWQAIGLRDSTVAGWASLRTLGTGAGQAAAGNHGHDLASASITGVLPLAKAHADLVRTNDARLAVTEVTVPLASGVTGTCSARRDGRTVVVHVDVIVPGSGQVGTLPAGYRPGGTHGLYGLAWGFPGAGAPVRLDVSAAGVVSLPNAAAGRAAGSLAFVTAS